MTVAHPSLSHVLISRNLLSRHQFTQFWMSFLKDLERARLHDVEDDNSVFLVQYLYGPRMQARHVILFSAST